MVALVSHELWREVLAEQKTPVILLVTAATPQERKKKQRAYLATRFNRTINEIMVITIDETYETPSSLAAERNAWLFADSAVGEVAPGSLKLARDMNDNWEIVYIRGGLTIALHQCRRKPQFGNRRRRR